MDRILRKSLKKKTGEKEAGEEVHNLLEDAAKRRRPGSTPGINLLEKQI